MFGSKNVAFLCSDTNRFLYFRKIVLYKLRWYLGMFFYVFE